MKKIKLSFFAVFDKKPFVCCLTAGLFMTLLLYFLNSRSFVWGLENIADTFGYFLFNLIILTAFYCSSLFFSRRLFVFTLVSVVWLAFGITNCIVIGMRDSALEAIDLQILRTGLAIIGIYLSLFEMILYAFLILMALGLLVLLFVKCPRVRPGYLHALLIFLCCLVLISFIHFAVIAPKNIDNDNITSDNVGFPYFFLCSIFDRGIDKPNEYSEEEVEKILKALPKESTSAEAKTPNVIFVQLESFFDVNRLENIKFSSNPIPNFTRLSKENGSGLFGIKAIGSGTANTEFEVLSGLDLEFFGVGEYPYTGILEENCCETIAYNLSALGYSAHAMHNHTAAFYDRYKVYANLGFDSFTAVEQMKNVEYNEIGWEKDKILTEYIFKALNSTEGKDFIFAVSVQGHGKYPDIPIYTNPTIEVFDVSDEQKYELEFFVNQLYEMDLFIGELYNKIMEFDEDTILVLYGDHLPALEISEEEFSNKSLYQTDYVIVSNFGHSLPDKDIYSWELSPRVLASLGIREGVINKVHAAYSNDKNFGEILRLMGYDTIYGKNIAGQESFKPKDMKMGIDEISITNLIKTEDRFVVCGKNFTPYSHIFLDGRKLETEFIDENTLYVEDFNLSYGDRLSVIQISDDLRKLSQSKDYVYSREFLD